ncbi:hypothetical protein ACEOWJ_000937 [Bacillus cereus]
MCKLQICSGHSLFLLGDNVNAQGRIKLFTEKDTCSSCNGVINQFKIRYPKIEIKVVHNNGNMISP